MVEEYVNVTVGDIESHYIKYIEENCWIADVYGDIANLVRAKKFISVPTPQGWITNICAKDIRDELLSDKYEWSADVLTPWLVKELVTIYCLVNNLMMKKSELHFSSNFHLNWLAIFKELPDIE